MKYQEFLIGHLNVNETFVRHAIEKFCNDDASKVIAQLRDGTIRDFTLPHNGSKVELFVPVTIKAKPEPNEVVKTEPVQFNPIPL
jgi:hypothetical protein